MQASPGTGAPGHTALELSASHRDCWHDDDDDDDDEGDGAGPRPAHHQSVPFEGDTAQNSLAVQQGNTRHPQLWTLDNTAL
eukprot:3125703-Rhodomonas_salina.1